MELTRREKTGLIVFIVILLCILSFYYYRGNSVNETEVLKIEDIDDLDKAEMQEEISVYICGEVKRPGVYNLKNGDRLIKLLEMAGGFTESADQNIINLAKKLKDEDIIKVPMKNTSINSNGPQISDFTQGETMININTADSKSLETLPRIGPATAKKIIDYREKNGPFKDIKDIKKVNGIGEKTFENLKDKITVD